ncbi:hypothetical protein KXX16_009423 [Aspergillus fumigatus]|nr:hypothetical protein KXX10_001956 [Aspergillus fumigatus]KAH1647318.1 hypothetical protein KXX16_009423 [Aspergillus fumigatus]KAH1869032.1 hypothetical protein KXX08_001941 [Aspergillus fumigatus]KAH2211957.1 hypothetical protein KXV58_009523 [Aspergillus fumigatus]KAH2272929.1 hypothetical protein KXW96_005200 [Aspergillus fumigatus]
MEAIVNRAISDQKQCAEMSTCSTIKSNKSETTIGRKWQAECFVPLAIRAENHYEKDWDIASLPNHDLPLEVLELDDIEIDGVHLSKLEPQPYEKHSSKLVHDHLAEYPYATVHSERLDMMRRLVDYRQALLKGGGSVGPKRPSTLSQFYEVFEQRMTRALWNFPLRLNGTFHPLRVVEPHYYYFRDINLFRYVMSAWGDQKVYGSLRRSFSYLQPLAPSLQGQTGLSPRLEALPAELQDMVFKNLHPLINPPQTCTRSLPARLWRDLLFYGLVLPWLWDLDVSALQSCPATSDAVDVPTFEAEEVWDGERLVRTLAQVDVFEPGQPPEHAPLRLRNRRRIWRLLEEAEDGDINEWVQIHVYNN